MMGILESFGLYSKKYISIYTYNMSPLIVYNHGFFLNFIKIIFSKTSFDQNGVT